MRKVVILGFLAVAIFLAGCVNNQPTQQLYKNDVITIENYHVDTLSPYSNDSTTIEFDVQSNSDEKINRVEVNFFDVPGFTVNNLDCGGIPGANQTNKCIFEGNNAFESLDSRRISLELTAPKVDTPTSYTISFSVSYNNSGLREAIIPIIDGVTKNQPTAKFQQSQPTYGPILLDIQPSLERTVKVGDKTITEYWGIATRSFETRFKFSNVGSVGNTKDAIIPINQINISKLENLQYQGFCDFSNSRTPTKGVKAPYDVLICNFKPTGNNQPEYPAIIGVTYRYQYNFIRTETFVVQKAFQ